MVSGIIVSMVVLVVSLAGTIGGAVVHQEQEVHQETTVPSNILFIDLFGTRSHKNFIMAIAEHLAQRNHSITYLTSYESTKERTNIREVYIPDVRILGKLSNMFNSSSSDMFEVIRNNLHLCSDALGSPEFQSVQNQKYDLAVFNMIFTECFLSFIHTHQIPLIYVSPNVIQGTYSDQAGTPFFSSVGGTISLDLDYPLTFVDRFKVMLVEQISIVINKWVYVARIESACRSRGLCSDDMPSLWHLRHNTSSLFITNSVRSLENPALPYTPSVIHAGGIHCRPSRPLPADLEEWVAGSGDSGFIFFSLGSLVKPSDMPEKYREVLVSVFASLDQRVLWKWDEDTMDNLPPNVRLSKWLPQQDILGHPQVRLFMTHGGLLSLQEATYHRVPVLGFPVAIDQMSNVRLVEREGWGKRMTWDHINYNTLRDTILEIIHDPKIHEEVGRRWKVMHDQPMTPGAWTTYWIEYIIRHRGAKHLHCPAVDMPWYELYNVDVWMTVVVVTTTVLFLMFYLAYKILRCLLSRCFYSKKIKHE